MVLAPPANIDPQSSHRHNKAYYIRLFLLIIKEYIKIEEIESDKQTKKGKE